MLLSTPSSSSQPSFCSIFIAIDPKTLPLLFYAVYILIRIHKKNFSACMYCTYIFCVMLVVIKTYTRFYFTLSSKLSSLNVKQSLVGINRPSDPSSQIPVQKLKNELSKVALFNFHVHAHVYNIYTTT